MKSLFSPSRTPKKLRDLAWTALAILTAWWVGLFYEFNLHKYFTIDEYSYAHIGWSWSQGKVLYRDVFAIHHPLTLWYFGIIQWIGGFLQLAWDQILLFLRLSILPVLLLTGGFVYLINRRFGIFGVAGALIGPLTVKIFMTRASEIRPDFICASLWLGCLAILCSQRFLGQTRKKKEALAGWLLGLAILGNQKVYLFAFAIPIVWLLDLWSSWRRSRPWVWRHPWIFAQSVLLPIGIAIILMGARGSVDEFLQMAYVDVLARESRGFHGLDYLYGKFMEYGRQAPVFIALACIGWLWDGIELIQNKKRSSQILLFLSMPIAWFYPMIASAAFGYYLIPVILIHAIYAGRAIYRLGQILPKPANAVAATSLVAGLVFWYPKVQARISLDNRAQLRQFKEIEKTTRVDDCIWDFSGSYVFRNSATFVFMTDHDYQTRYRDYLTHHVPRSIKKNQCIAMIKDLRFKHASEGLKDFVYDHYANFNGSLHFWGQYIEAGETRRFLAIKSGDYFQYPAAARLKINGDQTTAQIVSLNAGEYEVANPGLEPSWIIWLPADKKPFTPSTKKPSGSWVW